MKGLGAAHGQASVLVVGGLAAFVLGAFVFAAVGRGTEDQAGAQRAADLAALAGARAMHDAYTRLFEPVVLDHRPNPQHLGKDAYLALGRAAATATARANGAPGAAIHFPDAESFAPVRVEVRVARKFSVGEGDARRRVHLAADAVAELAPPNGTGFPDVAAGGGYSGPLAYRQDQPMRPDVALAFDRLDRAARAHGIALIINSAFRSDAEQAVLWRRHPDPRWVARPGTSLHRNATELDLGPPAAYAWLAAHAGRFHFLQRYSWEPWHQETPLALNDVSPRCAETTSIRLADSEGRSQARHWSCALGRLARRRATPARTKPARRPGPRRSDIASALLARDGLAVGAQRRVGSPARCQCPRRTAVIGGSVTLRHDVAAALSGDEVGAASAVQPVLTSPPSMAWSFSSPVMTLSRGVPMARST